MATKQSPSRAVIDSPSDSAADSGMGMDRRRSKREYVFTPGQIRSLQSPRPSSQHVTVTDVSLHGVGFRSTQQLVLDAMYEIEIGVGPLHLSSRMRIVRSLRRDDGTWDSGGEFC